MKWILILILFAFLILYMIVRFFFKLAIERNKKTFLGDFEEDGIKDESAKNLFEDNKKRMQQTIWQLTSDDGLLLKANFLDHHSKKVAIVCHGYTGTTYSVGAFANIFEDMGYSVLLPSARAHQDSEGSYIGFGWLERKDILLWIRKLEDELGNDIQIVLYGLSMGAGTVMMTSGEALPPTVKALIQDCGYTSVYDITAHQLKQLFKLPAWPIVDLTSIYCKVKAGYSFKEASSINQLKKNKLPILMIHGDQDDFVPFEHLQRNYDATNSYKEKYVVKGAGHGAAYMKEPEIYRTRIKEFLNRFIR